MNNLFFNKSFGFAAGLLMMSSVLQAQIEEPIDSIATPPSINIEAIDKARQLYNNFSYSASIDAFLKLDKLSTEDKLKVANAYRMTHDTKRAELWYRQVIEQDIAPIYQLHYAQTLQSNGKKQLAAQYFAAYAKVASQDDTWNEVSTSLAKNIEESAAHRHAGIELVNEKNLNSEGFDYSPIFFQDGVVFVSSRKPTISIGVDKDPWIADNFMSLFFAKKAENGGYSQPKTFSSSLTSIYHEGPAAYVSEDQTLYFSRNHQEKRRKIVNADGMTRMQIYQAVRNGKNWVAIKELAINDAKFDNCHPTLTTDGTTMYFASNREGGYGGMDLYVTSFNGIAWSTPENLGPTINTGGNEVFPFIHENETLFFSSNGYEGAGGLDVFYAKVTEKGAIADPTNLGQPFNSRKDDFGFILDKDGQSGFVSSARPDGLGKDDIYSFDLNNKMVQQYCIYDEQTKQPLSNAEIHIFEKEQGMPTSDDETAFFKLTPRSNNNSTYDLVYQKGNEKRGITDKIIADAAGYFSLATPTNSEYIIHAITENGDYHGILLPARTTNLFGNKAEDKTCISLKKVGNTARNTNNNTTATVVVKNRKYNKAVPSVAVKMLNLCTGEETEFTTDRYGKIVINQIECGCEFYFIGNKNNFTEGRATFSTIGDKCKQGGVVELGIDMVPSFGNSAGNTSYGYSGQATAANTSSILFNEEELIAGKSTVLEDIYYDYDQSSINQDAGKELDKVVELMRQYPNLTIELSSHTDIRGTSKYNSGLSTLRATKAVQYINEKGIATDRIFAKGYGEDRPRINCGSNCTEKEHQANRRTEIKILSFKNRTDSSFDE